ncbi:MAG: FKBP-type peptidyl-prolyl cis-trans isomerase [Bacteroidales bacterium]|nr:FKBP-type peptidyl-prolyl cis-trans isomerase [Bacteroidales bacterium]
MRYKLFFLIVVTGFYVSSCRFFSKYPGFKRAGHGIFYQLHSLGEDEIKANPGDYITVDLTYKTMMDSVFFNAHRKFQLTEPAFEGSVDECFGMLSEKESATFIISAVDFFEKTLQSSLPTFLQTSGKMKITVTMIDIQTETEYNKEKEAFLHWIEDFGEYEKVVLRQFIEEEKLPVELMASGIYFINLVPGTGKVVEPGDTITINYEGRFLNGKFFDSTIKRNQPFQFVYGTEWQVVKGLEDAIGLMKEGEKSLVILSSDLAFGNEGSSTGMIPPFTSLIFEVEILEVISPHEI